MSKEVSIPINRLKRLDELTEQYLRSQQPEKQEKLSLLIGYIQGVKFLI